MGPLLHRGQLAGAGGRFHPPAAACGRSIGRHPVPAGRPPRPACLFRTAGPAGGNARPPVAWRRANSARLPPPLPLLLLCLPPTSGSVPQGGRPPTPAERVARRAGRGTPHVAARPRNSSARGAGRKRAGAVLCPPLADGGAGATQWGLGNAGRRPCVRPVNFMYQPTVAATQRFCLHGRACRAEKARKKKQSNRARDGRRGGAGARPL